MTHISAALIDRLLYQSEGAGIDFKRTEYRFSNATDEEKSELLKDILAMANSWRAETGYILIGFAENRPNPAEVVGITKVMDDAAVQQFVNSKSLNRKLDFSYHVLDYGGKTVAVISIPKQPRPFYLVSKGYGKLKPGIVYVRRGSSTGEADPTELAKMGADDVSPKQVSMTAEFVNADGAPLETTYSLTHLDFGDIAKLPDYRSGVDGGFLQHIDRENSDYWRELAQFCVATFSHVQVRLKLKNTSGFSLTDLKVDVQALDANGAVLPLLDSSDWPDAPVRRKSLYDLSPRVLASVGKRDTSVEVEEGPDGPVAECKVLKVRPGQEVISEDFFAMTSASTGPATLRAVVYGNELGQPAVFEHRYSLQVKTKTRNFEDLRAAVSEKGPAFLVSDEPSSTPPAPFKLRPNDLA